MNTEKYKEFLAERETLESYEEREDFRERLNAYSQSYHEALIEKNIANLSDLNYNSITYVGYSPFVVLNVSKDEVNAENLRSLCNASSVEHISLGYDAKPESEASWADCMNATSAYTIMNNQRYTGESIKIGIYEVDGICDLTNANLVGKDITLRYPNEEIDDHATAVTSILALMVPDAEFYVSSEGGLNSGEEGVAWFISKGCEIVNCSWGYTNLHSYSQSIDALFDYQIRANLITVVKSAGNYNSVSNPQRRVTSPGYGYNVITVGGIDKTSAGNWEYSSIASYRTPNDEAKPTVVAPCVVDIPNVVMDNGLTPSGTSFAAPQVAACIAMLMEEDSTYMLHPEKVHALLTATATKTSDYSGITTGFDNKVGAGIVNIERMLSLTTDLHYINTNPWNGREVFSVDLVLDQTYEFGASLSWLSYVYGTIDEETSDRLYELHNTNYDLLIYDSSDTLVYYSTLTHSAVELVRFIVPTTDDYRIVVYQTGTMWALNNEDHIALSYYIDEDP